MEINFEIDPNVLLNLGLTCLFGFTLGFERQKHMKIIGFRTIMLLMLGAFVYSYISINVGADPTRVIGQVVTGIGFIGGGIIFKNGVDDIRNLTTAVLVWTSASIACLTALSYRIEALLITVIALLILHSQKYTKKNNTQNGST